MLSSRSSLRDYGATGTTEPGKQKIRTSARPRHHIRTPTHPLYHSTRKKPRRWPLVLRFIKGAIHINIIIPVLAHAGIAALICYLDTIREGHLSVPSSTIPSLSIVVGLMLVFRNQTSYDRFWQGNQHLTTIETNIRNLTRAFLTCSYAHGRPPPTAAERADTEQTVRVLLSLIYCAKNSLRSEWGRSLPFPLASNDDSTTPAAAELAQHANGVTVLKPEYSALLPPGTQDYEAQGLGLLLQLSVQVEGYIKRGHDRGWFHAPQASQMSVQLSSLVAAYGNMETIHLTPLPVAYIIHTRQVLALFCCVLPFALVREMSWWCILLVGFVAFTLYGIEAISQQTEHPFGYGRNDIKVDAIVEDLRVETTVLLEEWRRGSDMFPSPLGEQG